MSLARPMMDHESGLLFKADGTLFDLTAFLEALQLTGLLVSGDLQVGGADVADANPVPVSVITDPVSVAGTVAVEQSDASALKATIPPPTAFYHGQKAVTTAGTAEALGSTQALKKGVLVKALSTNTGKVYVGGEDVDSATGFELDFGDMTYIEIDDLAKVYVDAAVNGEGVSYVAS